MVIIPTQLSGLWKSSLSRMSAWGSSDWLQDAKRDGLAAGRFIQHPRNVSVMPFTQLAQEAEKVLTRADMSSS
jgi:hypothetical protein